MNSLLDYKQHFRFVAIVAAIASLGLIFFIRTTGSLALEPWQFALMLLPFALFGVAHLLLMYANWFVPGQQGMLATLKKTLFWILAATYTLLFSALSWYFVV